MAVENLILICIRKRTF